jgi:hypothetical protein
LVGLRWPAAFEIVTLDEYVHRTYDQINEQEGA